MSQSDAPGMTPIPYWNARNVRDGEETLLLVLGKIDTGTGLVGHVNGICWRAANPGEEPEYVALSEHIQ